MARRDRSVAGLSVADTGGAPSADTEKSDFGTQEADRYEEGPALGEGGMGVVHASVDRRLDREVAIKRVLPHGDPALRARLAREARITAGLEHPGIVPIYDAGLDEEGLPFYAMRLVRGRSLASVLESTPAHERSPLLRAFLSACEAVAYAHSRGVVHRDLKPANLMVGDFGEVLVVDWGLAVSVNDAGCPGDGTPGYSSPEQLAGQRAQPDDDVHALGVVLREVHPDPPAELGAVVAKATSPRGERYATAEPLARDLEAYLEGRRVAAYAYSGREVAARFLRAFRLPLSLAALFLLLLAMGVGVAGVRLSRERGRAVDAEAQAQAALQDAERSVASLLESQSVLAYERGAWPEAQVLASHALSRRDSPVARGVLAALPSPDLRWARGSSCSHPLATQGAQVLCADGATVGLWGGDAVGWERQGPAAQGALGQQWAAWSTIEDELTIVAARDGRTVAEGLVVSRLLPVFVVGRAPDERVIFASSTTLYRWSESELQLRKPCGEDNVQTLTAAADVVVVGCPNGEVVQLDESFERVSAVACRSPGTARISALALDLPTGRLAVGDLDGRVTLHRIGDAGPPLLQFSEPASRIRELRFFQDAILSRGEYGSVRVSDRSGGVLFRLPQRVVRILDAGDDSLTLASRDGVETLAVDGFGVARQHQLPEGLTAIGDAPGLTLAARGDGILSVLETTGRRDLQICEGCALKAVAVSPDGRHIAVALANAGDGLRVFDRHTFERVAGFEESRALRRLAYFADGRLLTLGYGPDFGLWSRGGAREAIEAAPALDLAATDNGAFVWAVGLDGTLVRVRSDGTSERMGSQPGALAVAPLGDREAWVVTSFELRRVVASGEATLVAVLDGTPLDIAVDGDAEVVALGFEDGRVEVRSIGGERIATLRAHRRRVSFVAFEDGGLRSASWDGTTRLWDATVWRTPTSAADAGRRWATDLDRVLTISTR